MFELLTEQTLIEQVKKKNLITKYLQYIRAINCALGLASIFIKILRHIIISNVLCSM